MAIFTRSRANKAWRLAPPVSAVAALFAVAVLAPVHAGAQSKSSPAESKAAAKTWRQTRTPDGQPDLQGYWSNASLIPLERPAAAGGREFLTAEELEKNEAALKPKENATVHYNFGQYGLDPLQTRRALSRRTSMIIDPPDGKLPPLSAEAKQRAAARAAAR